MASNCTGATHSPEENVTTNLVWQVRRTEAWISTMAKRRRRRCVDLILVPVV